MKDYVRKLADELEVTGYALMSMANSSSSYYRTFQIPKRISGFRNIDSPHVSLLNVQRKIKTIYLPDNLLSIAATAYRPNMSIVDNARAHKGCRYLLKVDIENFFGSISFRRVLGLFQSMVDDKNTALLLTQLVTYKKVLPQGAATSPAISNLVTRHLDKRLTKFAETVNATYTRYSDDIALSSELQFKSGALNSITKIVSEEGFILNSKKTQFIESYKKVVTGIYIHGEELNVPKDFRRQLKADTYKLYRGLRMIGLEAIEDPIVFERLRGRLNYWKQVSPRNTQLAKTEQQLNEAYQLFNKLLT